MINTKVKLGANSNVSDNAELGVLPRGTAKPTFLEIGKNCVIRSFTTIYYGTKIGDNFQTGHGALIREDNVIGDNCSVGTNAVLEHGNRIGNNCRIHTGCFLERVTLGNNIFLGPHVVFTDDPHPPCPRAYDCMRGATVGDYAKIGANVTLLPGIEIGKHALIGSGSVVTKDVPAGKVWAGNPARQIKDVNELKCVKNYFKVPYEWEK